MGLPLFPLHAVLFPGRTLPLRIFEARYREMLGDCLAGDRRFGVLSIRHGREVGTEWIIDPIDREDPETDQISSDAGPDPVPSAALESLPESQLEGVVTRPATSTVHPVGTVAELTFIQANSDQTIDITVRGLQRFRVDSVDYSKRYLSAAVTALTDSPGRDLPGAIQRLDALITPLFDALGLPHELRRSLPTSPGPLAYSIADAMPLDTGERQRLLEIDNHTERLDRIAEMIRLERCITTKMATHWKAFRPIGPCGSQLN